MPRWRRPEGFVWVWVSLLCAFCSLLGCCARRLATAPAGHPESRHSYLKSNRTQFSVLLNLKGDVYDFRSTEPP